MLTPETIKADRIAERSLAAIGILATVAGLGAEQYPAASLAILAVLALALIWAAIASELARRSGDQTEEYFDADSHLAEVANQLERRA